MQRGRRHYVPSVRADIDTRRQPDLVAGESSRMREIEMAAATPGPAFQRCGHRAVLEFDLLQSLVPAVSRVDIDHDQAGDGTGHDSDASPRPLAKPAARFRLTGMSMLKLLPADQRSLISCPDRDDRPASSHVVVNGFVDRDHRVNPSGAFEFQPRVAMIARVVALTPPRVFGRVPRRPATTEPPPSTRSISSST